MLDKMQLYLKCQIKYYWSTEKGIKDLLNISVGTEWCFKSVKIAVDWQWVTSLFYLTFAGNSLSESSV